MIAGLSTHEPIVHLHFGPFWRIALVTSTSTCYESTQRNSPFHAAARVFASKSLFMTLKRSPFSHSKTKPQVVA